jgi:hypothetical protein
MKATRLGATAPTFIARGAPVRNEIESRDANPLRTVTDRGAAH